MQRPEERNVETKREVLEGRDLEVLHLSGRVSTSDAHDIVAMLTRLDARNPDAPFYGIYVLEEPVEIGAQARRVLSTLRTDDARSVHFVVGASLRTRMIAVLVVRARALVQGREANLRFVATEAEARRELAQDRAIRAAQAAHRSQ
jgi:hypothetical protein